MKQLIVSFLVVFLACGSHAQSKLHGAKREGFSSGITAAGGAPSCNNGSDNFVRANENPLSDAGQWHLVSTEASAAQVLGNVCTNTGGTMTFAYYFSNSVPWCSNQISSVWVMGTGSTVSGDGLGPIVRAQVGARQYYELLVNNSTQLRLAERNGSSTVISNHTPFAYSSGMKLTLAATNDTPGVGVGNILLRVYTNDVLLMSVRPVALAYTNGYPGIKEGGQSNGTEWFTNWVGSSSSP